MQAEDWKSISKVRLERAVEFLGDSLALYNEGRYRSAASRLYFSAFHAMRAVLALDGIDRKHHSGIISEFRKLYVKTGVFDRTVSSIIATISLRQHRTIHGARLACILFRQTAQKSVSIRQYAH